MPLQEPVTIYRDTDKEDSKSYSKLDKIAVLITNKVGTFGFFLVIFTWTVVWLSFNTLGPKGLRFDPAPGFVFWLFISNMIQLMLMPLIMIGQNLQSKAAEVTADADFLVNSKAEKQNEEMMAKLQEISIALNEILPGKKIDEDALAEPEPDVLPSKIEKEKIKKA